MDNLAIVVVNYNDSESVLQFIENTRLFSDNVPIIVVDNNSTDGSVDVLKAVNYNAIELVELKENKGYSYGNNMGIKFVKEKYPKIEYVAISNPDIILNEKSLSLILQGFIDNPDYSGLTGRMYNPDNKPDPFPYLTLPTFKRALLFALAITRKFLLKSKTIVIDEKVKIKQVEALPGCFFVFRIKDFWEIGLFDENVFLYYEENILGIKCRQNGLKLGIIPNAHYIHNHSVSINKSFVSYQKVKIYNKSVCYYFSKYTDINKLELTLLKAVLTVGAIESQLIYIIRRCFGL